MTLRARLIMTWNVRIEADLPESPFETLDRFYAFARGHLVTRFAKFQPEVAITLIDQDRNRRSLKVVWDINLSEVAGPYHEADDFFFHAKTTLMDNIVGYGEICDMDVLVEMPLGAAIDHGEILLDANRRGLLANPEDFPVFVPQPIDSWPKANQVFRQDGFWWWSEAGSHKLPMVGPQPEKIFTRWDASRRDRFEALANAHQA